MKRIPGCGALTILLGLCFSYSRGAQAQETNPGEPKSAAAPKEESSVTEHTIRIGNQEVPCKATAGTILLYDEDGHPNASIFHVSYVRSDVKDLSQGRSDEAQEQRREVH